MSGAELRYGNRILDSVLCAMATAVYFAVVLPLQSYLSNAESFAYGLQTLLGECLIVALSLFAAVAVLTWICSQKFGRVAHLAFLVAILLSLLEAGPLAIGLPELNGEFDGYRLVWRTIMDYSVLGVALALPWVFYRGIAPFIAWISVAIAVYSVATVFDIKQVAKSEVDGIAASYLVPRDDVVNSARFSANDNVIVLILDATSQFVAQDIFQDKQLAARYDGFVNYVNNVGMHWNTAVGIPGLMTGKYYENALDLPRYGKSSYGSDSFACAYIDKNIPVYVNVGPGRMGCCNHIIGGNAGLANDAGFALNQPMHGQFELSLVELCVFRLLPYNLKERFLQRFIREQSGAPNASRKWNVDNNLYSFLAAKGVSASAKRTLNVHHTQAGHPPIVYDERGKKIVCETPGYAEYRGQCKNAFRCVAELFDVWRTNGVYDASTIIMAADHSASVAFTPPGKDLHGADSHAFPFLMIKTKGDRTAYRESELPTSHCRIAEVAKTLADRPLSRSEIESILITTNRLVRLAHNGKIIEWEIAPDRTVKKTVRPDSEPDICTIKPLSCDVSYSFRIDSGSGVYPDFVVANGNRNVTSGLAVIRNPMRLKFRVLDPACVYRLEFTGVAKTANVATNRLVASCGGVTNANVACTKAYKAFNAMFADAKADADGVIECLFSCDDIGFSNYVVNGLRLSVNSDVLPGKQSNR